MLLLVLLWLVFFVGVVVVSVVVVSVVVVSVVVVSVVVVSVVDETKESLVRMGSQQLKQKRHPLKKVSSGRRFFILSFLSVNAM